MKNILETPLQRFENIKDFPFTPHYCQVDDGLKMHYVDEGEKTGQLVLLLHGEPTWSYMYRHMIPPLIDQGYRVIAPDLIGFGKSDKFSDRSQYTYSNHLKWLKALIVDLQMTSINMFCQDWGGLLGLRLVPEMPERFNKIIASNTVLPTGHVKMPEAFMFWRAYSQKSETFDMGKIIDSATVKPLSDDTKAAYNAPFPDETYKAGARQFPMIVPVAADDPECLSNKEAWAFLKTWKKPFLTIYGDEDMIMKGAEKFFQEMIPGAKDQPHKIIHAGHFIQEDAGPYLAKAICQFLETS